MSFISPRTVSLFVGGSMVVLNACSSSPVEEEEDPIDSSTEPPPNVRRDFDGESIHLATFLSDGTPITRGATLEGVSGDGRFLVFTTSEALVDEDENGVADVYRHELATGENVLVSLHPVRGGGDRDSHTADISDSGRYVVFTTRSSKFEEEGAAEETRAYLRDLVEGTLTSICVDSLGVPLTRGCSSPSISGGGEMVAFRSTTTTSSAHVWERSTGTSSQENVTSSGAPLDGVQSVFLSSDGKHLSFTSGDESLGGADNGQVDVFLRNLEDGNTELVTRGVRGDDVFLDYQGGSLSADGRYVAFKRAADLTTSGGRIDRGEAFLFDTTSGNEVDFCVDESGESLLCVYAWISIDGSLILFTSDVDDIYVHDLESRTTYLVSVSESGERVRDAGAGMSGDGRLVALSTNAPFLEEDANDVSDIFVIPVP